MGLGAGNSNERLRTIWTPEMDCYFVDLLLQQVGDGGRFDDHLFSKRAWNLMSSIFNAKFKFQYEKDILKNRYKTLRNLYRGVKNLLAEPGFSWDEKRSMVTADNSVWDDYLKLHPPARSYRIRSIPYFKDLCTIYGHAIIEEKGDDALEDSSNSVGNKTNILHLAKNVGEDAGEVLHDVKLGEDHKISAVEDATDDSEHRVLKETSTSFSTRTRTYWQPPMDRYFIDLMLSHVHQGNRADGVFSKQAWMDMLSSFNEKFGFDYSLENLKNRYKTLRRQYNLIKNLLDLDGFAWDEARQMITADDSVWQDCIKVHPDARQFMTRPLPYYEDLCLICDANFVGKGSSLSQDLEYQDIVDVKIDSLWASKTGQSSITSNCSEEPFSVAMELVHTGQKQKRQLENCSDSASPKKPRDDEDGMAVALSKIATAVSSLSTKRNNESSVSIECVIQAVQALPDMDEDLVLDACDFLEDERKAKTFLALDPKLRKKWLIRKLRT